jgi:hypothetical protein
MVSPLHLFILVCYLTFASFHFCLPSQVTKKGPNGKPRPPVDIPPPPPPLPERGSNFAEIAKCVTVDESEDNAGERVEGESSDGDALNGTFRQAAS